MEPSRTRGMVSAHIYSPMGDLTCEVIDCDSCKAQALYTPYAGRYHILVALGGRPAGLQYQDYNVFFDLLFDAEPDAEEVAGPFLPFVHAAAGLFFRDPQTSGHHDFDADYEFGSFEYMLRVFNDDHGNHPSLATPLDTPALNATVTGSGYLTRDDDDWFDFVAAPFSTYRVETTGSYGVRLNVSGDVEDLDDLNDDFGQAAFLKRNIDGRNDFAIYQTGTRETVYPFSVRMDNRSSEFNPFRLDQGPFGVSIFGDDHVDWHVSNAARATALTLGTAGSGKLWPADTDMFVADMPKAHFMYKTSSSGATQLRIATIANHTFQNAGNAQWPGGAAPKDLEVFIANVETGTKLYVAVEGLEADLTEAEYTVKVEEDDHRNFTGGFTADVAAATAITIGTPRNGVLWPGDTDVFKVSVTQAQVDAGGTLEITLTPSTGLGASLAWWQEDGDPEFGSPITVIPEVAGDYCVIVSHQGGAAGTYTIGSRIIPAPVEDNEEDVK